MSSKMVQVKFCIDVRGMVGGSFEMTEANYKRIRKQWETRKSIHDETDTADELLGLAPFNFFDHLNVDEMEITELDVVNE